MRLVPMLTGESDLLVLSRAQGRRVRRENFRAMPEKGASIACQCDRTRVLCVVATL